MSIDRHVADATVVSLPTEDTSTQASRAHQEVLRRIATLRMAPGSTFTERELAAELGVGKAPLREALQRLVPTGLIRAETGNGYVVSPITLREARNLFELWHILIGTGIGLVVERNDETTLAEHMAGFQKVEEAVLAGTDDTTDIDPVAFEILFQQLVVTQAHNTHLTRAVSQVGPELERLLRFAQSLGARIDGLLCDHEPLAAAIVARDGPGARAAAIAILEKLEHAVIDALLKSAKVQDVNLAGT